MIKNFYNYFITLVSKVFDNITPQLGLSDLFFVLSQLPEDGYTKGENGY